MQSQKLKELFGMDFSSEETQEKVKKEKATDKFRRMFPVYQENGYTLNWNPNTKSFYLWKENQEFFQSADGCWHIFFSFKNSDEDYDVCDIEQNIGILERKIARHLETTRCA